MDGAITLRKVATDCIKTVRSVTESEEEAVELVLRIWETTVKQTAHSLKVGRSVSLMPLGVVHNTNNASGGPAEPSLAISELFIMQYGISVKPGGTGAPGPSTKPVYSEIATAVHISDKTIVPNVLTAVIHRMGEMMAQHAKVRIDFSPLGEMKSENQRVEFLSTITKEKAVPPASTEPKRTVRAMLARRRKEIGQELGEKQGGKEAASGEGDLGSPIDGGTGKVAVDPESMTKMMARKRVEMVAEGNTRFAISPRQAPPQPAEPMASLSTAPSITSQKEIPTAAQVESQGILQGEFKRSLPPHAMQYPPLLEEFSRTLAVPYGEELYCGSTSGRIAAHFSPLASMLVWSAEQKSLRWKQISKDDSKNGKSTPAAELEAGHDIRDFENLRVADASPLDVELKEAQISRKQLYAGLNRYKYYVTEGIDDSVVAPINQAWVDNVGFLVDAEKFIPELGSSRADRMLSEVHTEMHTGYIEACKRAITNYVLKDPKCQERALVFLVPAPVADWGSKPFEGIEGTYGGPPHEWRAGIEQNRESVVSALTICNRSSLRLLHLWNGVGYGNLQLIDLPGPVAPPVEIFEFYDCQSRRREEIVRRFETQWFEEVCSVLRDETEHLNTPTEGRFLESVSTLLATQTRSVVEQTMYAFVDFFGRYSNPQPRTPEEITKLTDLDEREPAFLLVKLIAKNEEIRFKDTPDRILEKISKIFRDFVESLNGVERPESRLSRGNMIRKEKKLWGVSLDEGYVKKAEKAIENILSINLTNMEKALLLYKDYTHLLTEEERMRQFVEEPSHTSEMYMAQVEKLRTTEQNVRKNMPSEIRMQMICVDCRELNETLCNKANECIRLLLENIAERNRNRNNSLFKNFENVANTITKKPTSAAELVDLEATLEQFRAVEMKTLVDEFNSIREWMEVNFKCEHLLQGPDFKAMKESANWVQSIDGIVNSRETDLKVERDSLENKFKGERAKFEEDLQGYLQLVNKFKDAGNLRQMDEYLERILALKEKFDRAKCDAEKFNEKEVLLGWEATEFERLHEGIDKLEPYDKLWSLAYEFTKASQQWTRGPLFSLEPEAVDQEANTMWRTSFKLQATFEQMELPQPSGVAKHIKTQLDSFKQNLPLVHALCNPGLRSRHWDEISNIVGFAMEPDNSFTLSRVIDMEVGKHMAQLQEISDSAAKEYMLEKSLETMLGEWQPVKFELKKWKDTGTFIVHGTTVEEMQGLMDDHIIKTQTMKGSPYAKPFESRILEWEGWLINTQQCMDIWMRVQSVWLYLEPIFSSEDIMKQMPTEGKLFQKVDQNWRGVMSAANEGAKALVVTKMENLYQKLQECHENLETVQKGLNDYLETKRLAFPRFFFLSNDNLLEILSETKDPTRVNPHMKKAFEGIQALEFQPDTKITAMFSSEKEKVPVTTVVDPVKARGNVELWLIEVEAAMVETIRAVTMQSSEDYKGRKFAEWLKIWPGQTILCIFNIYWTIEVTEGLRNEGSIGVGKYGEKLENVLQEIVEMVRGDIPALVRCTLEALIVIFVHNKDTVNELFQKGIEKEDDFDWVVQLRYFIEENPEKPGQQDVFVRITNSHLAYAYEYLGNSSRLVVTPLTDRCYRTCCGALHLLYGAAPEGPAGTGKTETVKDLAKALARMCVVFNCSDELDYMAMGKFFKGLAASGGWACFDEFNRIDAEVLSVVAQQILSIQAAIKQRLNEFEFEGTMLPIRWTANCFITMNPGYAGRAELPDNLKALFRTVAMMVPDYALIAEIKLYAYGYEDSRSLAQKIVTTYKLCSEQLSSQHHYDYGMRAVFSVLVAAGNLKRKYGSEDESVLMLRSINDVNLAKFLDFDVPLFRGITSDLFPGVTLPKPDYSLLIGKLEEHLKVDFCQPHPYFIEKIVQFYECHTVRHSVMLVGLPFSGKTTGLRTLQKALTDLANEGSMHAGCIVHQARLNPKSIPPRDLYGCFDEVSHEWTDGIVAVLFREFGRNQTEERKWLVFDGPVDAVWIENMNTVMDENKKLCLNSGEIIAMSANMRTIMEPMDVEVASPATISRNGMVYFEPHLMGIQHLLDKYYLGGLHEKMDDEDKKEVKSMTEWLIPPLCKFLRENCKEVSPTQDQNLVQSFILLLKTHLDKGFAHETYQHENGDPKPIIAMIDSYILFSLIWSIGSVCETASRAAFNQYMRKLIAGNPEVGIKQFKKLQPPLPDRGSIFDYCFNLNDTAWQPWMETVEPQNIPNNAKAESIIVQTMDNVRYRYLLDHCIANRLKLLFCGPTGTGKTAYMEQAMNALEKDSYFPIFICFSAQSKCAQTQDLIDAKLDRRRKGVFGPPVGKIATVMIDDLNMPAKETYGAQPPIEILRQMIDNTAYPPSGGWYDRADSAHPFKSIIDVLLFTAMGPPGGGRTFVTPRMLGHFFMVGFPLLDDDNMCLIFQTILDWKFRVDNYPSEVQSMTRRLVQGTLDIYKIAAAELLPTPMKVHYTFNLRDFAKVVNGMLLLGSKESEGTDRHIRLWTHEIQRVFGDRLNDEQDRNWLLVQLRDTVKKQFQCSFDEVFRHLDNNGDNKVDTVEEIRMLFFSDMMSVPASPKRPYVECLDVQALQKEVESHLESHNMMSNKPMDLVCFLYMLEHLSRVARVIKSQGGHELMVGVGGSGRQSCTQLACFMADLLVFGIEIAKGYDRVAFREDLKKLMIQAGGKGDGTVFLFSDAQIKEEGFVEDINNMLNSGEVPNLFPPEERVAVCEMVRSAARNDGSAPEGTPAQLFAYFLKRCRQNLNIALCFSPIGDGWRARLRQFPSLVNCTTIDWFTEWPTDALTAVATKFLATVPDLEDTVRESCVSMTQMFHSSASDLGARFKNELKRIYYATPTSFLELIQTFKQLLGDKRKEVSDRKSKYEVGLEKLMTTEQSVEGMKQELIALQPKLIDKNKEVGEMMVVVNEETAKTEKVKEVVAADEAVASEAAAKANAIKEDCEKDLAEAMPALNESLKALDTLTGKDISEIKAMKSPAPPVKLVLSACCVMKALKPARVKDDGGRMVDDYWPTAVKMISEMGFLQSLQTFDKDNIPPAIIKKISTYTTQEDFQPDRVANVSKAAYGLCMWVRAMETYDRVAKVVAPKKEKLGEAEAEYAQVMVKLNEKRAELQKVIDQLQKLNDRLSALKQEQDDLAYQVDLCQKKLERAETLINSLGSEKERWTQNAQELAEDFVNLTGDVIVASGVIAYLGAFTPEFRDDQQTVWVQASKTKEIPGSEKLSLENCLGDPVAIRSWTIAGLPNDSFSIENAIIVDKARRWPLCIDPQGQANNWIKQMEKGNQLLVCKLTDGDYLKRLEGAIQFGNPTLIENVTEETDPALEPVLLRQVFKKGGMMMMKLGEAEIEYSKDFKFYMTTKLRNPHYLPEIAVKVTLLNFMITIVGLQDQVLNIVVAKERPELAEEKARLVVEGAENKAALANTENKILDVLSNSQGNILEDEAAIQILSASKQLSNEISEKQKIAEETEAQIDEARANYVPTAFRTSILFFCIADMANIDPMYQYSLPFFIKLFVASIDRSPEASVLEERIAIINDFFLTALYNNICRSLFEEHKLLFSFLLCVRLRLSQDKIDMNDYRFLLTGGVSLDDPPSKPADWVPDRCWAEIFRLGKTSEKYKDFHDKFSAEVSMWKKIYDDIDPMKLIQDGKSRPVMMAQLDCFQDLLVLRCVRPDRVLPAVMHWVAGEMGEKFVTPPTFDLAGSYADASNTSPLIFILSPGSDPFTALNKYATERQKELNGISLGQGQGPKAEKLMEEAMKVGSWVILQNCHLATSWMPKLDRMLEQQDPKHIHQDYRLWLTSYPSSKFPVAILQNSVKLTNEPPKGLRANLNGSFHMDPISNEEEFFDKCNKPEEFKRLLFCLCFFHAVIQERRLFGPLGWNIPYEFTENDLRISAYQLQMFLDEAPPADMPIKALIYLTGECNYGGRVTDDKDRRLIMTLLADCYCQAACQESFKLCVEHPEYVVPTPGPLESVWEHIANFPLVTPPGVFGFHENANLTKFQNETYKMMDLLLLTMAQSSSGGGATPEQTVGQVADDILRRMPKPWNLTKVQSKYPTQYTESMNTVLLQELTRFNKLIEIVLSTLKDIQKAIKGLLLMSQQLEGAFLQMYDGKTPGMWLAKSYPSLKPLGSYVSDLVERLKFFQTWVDDGIPVLFWMSGIYFTQAFTTGAAQNYARKYTIPIDTLSFDFEFPKEQDPKEKPQDGVFTYGSFLEGCKWDWEKWELSESDPKVLYVSVPLVWIVPCKKTDVKETPHYTCPMYKVSSRKGTLSTTGHSTNFVMFINTPSSIPETHWTKRGVAMLTQLDT